MERIVSWRQFLAASGYRPTRARELIARGKLPRPVKLPGGRAKGFLESEIAEYQAKLIAERDNEVAS